VKVDGIVNAANKWGQKGGGLDREIRNYAGPQVDQEMQQLYKDPSGVRIPVGGAVVTGAYNLPSKLIIHAVGPDYNEGLDQDTYL